MGELPHVTASRLRKLRKTRRYEPGANGRGLPPYILLTFLTMAEARPADGTAVSTSLHGIADELPQMSAALPDARYDDMKATLDGVSANLAQVLTLVNGLTSRVKVLEDKVTALTATVNANHTELSGE